LERFRKSWIYNKLEAELSIFASQNNIMNNSIKLFKTIAILEGLSFLLLLGIAMPLKYVWGYHQPTQIVGMAHGILFIAYVIMVMLIRQQLNWSYKTTFIALVASVLPFGPFVVDRRLLPAIKKTI